MKNIGTLAHVLCSNKFQSDRTYSIFAKSEGGQVESVQENFTFVLCLGDFSLLVLELHLPPLVVLRQARSKPIVLLVGSLSIDGKVCCLLQAKLFCFVSGIRNSFHRGRGHHDSLVLLTQKCRLQHTLVFGSYLPGCYDLLKPEQNNCYFK